MDNLNSIFFIPKLLYVKSAEITAATLQIESLGCCHALSQHVASDLTFPLSG